MLPIVIPYKAIKAIRLISVYKVNVVNSENDPNYALFWSPTLKCEFL